MTERLILLSAATQETELGDHDFCLSRREEGLQKKRTETERLKEMMRLKKQNMGAEERK